MRRFAAALAALALLAVACGESDVVVASVNGVDIRQSDVLGLKEQRDDAVSVIGSEFRDELFNLITQQVVVTALEDEFGVRITDADVEAELARRLEESGATEEEAIASLQEPGATRDRLLRIVRSGLLGQAATRALGARPEFVAGLFDDTPELITEVCVRHIVVETRAEAEDVSARLQAGEEFAAVAVEVSLDPTANGDLGCTAAGSYVEEFAAATMVAPVGQLFGPVETGFGYHVLIVDDRRVPDREDAIADPDEFLPAAVLQAEFSRWFNEKVDEADISVLSRVGTWVPEGPGILPPG